MVTRSSIFVSYARGDDEPFVWRLYERLKAAGFNVWFDRVSMPSRELSFYQEIRDAIAACDRLVLVVGPKAIASDYVMQEWRFAYFEALKCVNPIVRLDGKDGAGKPIDGYSLILEDLRLIHAEDFRRDDEFELHITNFIRQLSEPLPPAGKLVAVPELPPHFVVQPDRIAVLRDILLADLTKPVVVSGAAGRVGVQGMGGIGKSVLASALAHRPEMRRAFPDGVYWVTLGQEPHLEELQQSLLKALGDDGVFSGVEGGTQKLRETLAGRAALLILDDAWQRLHADAFNVVSGRCRLLLTTRDVGLVTALAASENHYQVQLPTMAEAEALLAKAAGTESLLPPEARAVIEQCGRLPLALALCGGMAHRRVPWSSIMAALRRHKLEHISDRYSLEAQHADVWRAIDASVHVLGGGERERFAELAVFAIDAGAPEAAVLTLWEHTAGLDTLDAQLLLSEFAERSLIERDEKDGRIRLHDLIHNFATAMAAKQFGSEAALHRRLLDAYAKKCPGGWHSGPNDGYFLERLCGHLLAAGKVDDAVALLTGVPWLEVKCRAKLVLSLHSDYQALLREAPPESLPRRGLLGWVREAFELSLHVLIKDPEQLASQMVGRLFPLSDYAEVAKFVAEMTAAAPRPWLRPLAPALHPPGTPLVRTLAGHTDVVSAVSLTADGRFAVSASWDNMLKVWDLPSGREVHTLEGHTSLVRAVSVTADGRFAVSASDDSTLKVWELASGREVHTLKGGYAPVSLRADGRFAVSASWDHTLKVWDLATGREVHTLKGHTWTVRAVSLTADGRFAVSASGDKTLKVWDLESGREVHTLKGHTDWVTAVSLTADGRFAVSASEDGTLKVWDLESGREVRTLAGHTGPVNAVSMTADGRFAVSASWDHTLKVWDLATGREVHTLKGHTDCVTAVSLTADGRFAVSASWDHTLKVWELATGREVRTLPGHTSWVYAVSLTPDERFAVSASFDHTLKVWDLASGREVLMLPGHTNGVNAVSLTADGRFAVSASGDKTLKVWDLESGREVRTLSGHERPVWAVSLTPDGRFAVSASADHTLRVWELASGREVRTLKGHTDSVGAVSLTADGRLAVSASGHPAFGTYDHTLKVWDLESGREVRTLVGHTNGVTAVSLTPDERFAVSASSDNTLKVWELANGRDVHTLKGHSLPVGAVTLTADGRFALSASRDNTLKVWELASGREVRTLTGHTDQVEAVSLTADGRFAVSASWDNTLKVWDLESGREVSTLKGHTGRVNAVSLTADGRFAVSGSDDHTLKVWDLATGKTLATFTCEGALECCAFYDEGRLIAGDQGGRVYFVAFEE
jgi:WD40 repeat protein